MATQKKSSHKKEENKTKDCIISVKENLEHIGEITITENGLEQKLVKSVSISWTFPPIEIRNIPSGQLLLGLSGLYYLFG